MQHQADHNEQMLLEKLRQGDAEAFERIFRLHWHRLYVLAKTKVQSHDEAEEIIQHIFSSLWEKRETLLITNLTFYLNTAVRNHVINLVRNRITHEKYWTYYKTFIPEYRNVTHEEVEFGDLNNAVEEAVNRLPEKSRKVFKLSRIEGRSNAEIADLLHLSEKAIEYHLTQSLRKLRVHLKDFMVLFLPFFF
ncbi:RNA polymerase sigma-70 factor [Fulvivirgaceae bacterium PWU4]|uniref:RNA polymerase sigma-70 factor n=1 Tax=Chryseosolibacter histidini TaxID=2782349 RepID=A0AAP2DKI3_9BACT|nr:RNA polymerase sigma-70 factor [Chryseosolibacter histidini]MBT1697189.1 RNA polymerase sigma-70 factor [Chryseosolibacter histidini]